MQKRKSTSPKPGVPPSQGPSPADGAPDATSGKAAAVEAAEPRIIKKYPNRRLYDTETSTYITLTEVRQLVMDSAPFVVRDAKNNEDLTRSILLQIILEEEAGGEPMFTRSEERRVGKECRL